jgi:chemotaxis protein MotA
MEDTEALGHAIAAAFIATLLGIFTGYVLWHPMANKLKRKTKQEVLVRTIIMEGIVGICRGMNPRMLKDNLSNYISARERETS